MLGSVRGVRSKFSFGEMNGVEVNVAWLENIINVPPPLHEQGAKISKPRILIPSGVYV